MASQKHKKTHTGDDLPSTAATNRFSGRVAIFVTGGASGIGKATVKRLASEGATVAIFDINKAAGEQVAAEFCSEKLDIKFFEVDVCNKELCVEATKQFAQMNNGKLHFLVNCAVIFDGKGLTAERKDWDKSFSVNVVGYANMVQSCYEYMKDIPGDRTIVNLASAEGYTALPNRWTYASTKAAIVTMTKGMALDLSKDCIRVKSPGWVWGPEVAKEAVGGREKWEPIWGQYHMLRRLAECSEIASAVCFLLSEDASFITATDLFVDGGYITMGPEGLGESSSFAGSDY